MIREIVIALILTPLLVVAWAAVQQAWSRAFRGPLEADDALEGRGGCGACGTVGGRCTETTIDTQPGDHS